MLHAICSHSATAPWLETKCELHVSLWVSSCPVGPFHYISLDQVWPGRLPCRVTSPITVSSLIHRGEMAPCTPATHTHTYMQSYIFVQTVTTIPCCERLSRQPCLQIISSLSSLGHEITRESLLVSVCFPIPSATLRVAATLRASWLI